MDGRPTLTVCDEAGDYVVPNVLSPRDLVFRPDNMNETVPHTHKVTVFSSGSFCQIYRVTDEALIAETMALLNFLMNVFFALKGSKLFTII